MNHFSDATLSHRLRCIVNVALRLSGWAVQKMKKIKRYGLPLLTAYGWQIVGRVLVTIGFVGLMALQLGAVRP